jgi:acetyltransferase-like isoleucine patch superfamily enzyme
LVSRSGGHSVPSREDVYLERGWKTPLLFKAASKITWLPLFMIAIILIALSLIGPIYIMSYFLENYKGMTPHPFLDVVILGASFGISYITFGLGLLIFGPLIKWLLGIFSHQREGEYPYFSPVAGYWSIVNGIILFNRHLFLEITRTTFLINLFYTMMGMRIGRGTLINTTYLHDPDLIRVGRNVTFGGDVMVLGHVGERGILKLKSVRIDDDVDIGQSSLVMPGCHLGKGSIIGAHSIVTKNTIIAPYEIWTGVPARKIGNVRPPGKGSLPKHGDHR